MYEFDLEISTTRRTRSTGDSLAMRKKFIT